MRFRDNLPTLPELRAEAREIYRMLPPMIVANLLTMLNSLITTTWVGRMGETELAGSALGSMTVSISLSVAIGLITAVDTLAAQAAGAGNLARVGVVMQRGMLVVLAYALPLSAVWWWIGPLLVAARQPRDVSALAAQYTRCVSFAVVPCFFAQAVAHALVAAGRAVPTFVFMLVTTLAVALCSWLNVSVVGLRFLGPPLALGGGWTVGFVALLAFASLSGAFRGIWTGFSREALREVPHFLGLAVPGILMTCADWVAFEACALIAGTVSQKELATFSLLYQTMCIMFMFPMSFGICGSARVGNALGAGAPRQARAAITVTLVSSASTACVYLTVVGCVRQWWPMIFTNEPGVIAAVAEGIPVLCVMEAMDALQAAESGLMRGAGMQKFGAVCNFIFYYIVGLPLAAFATLYLEWGARGIFIAMCVGMFLQLVTFSLRLWLIDWDELARTVSEREAKRRLAGAKGDSESSESTALLSKSPEQSVNHPTVSP